MGLPEQASASYAAGADLAAVASQAAVELDNLVLRRSKTLDGVGRLVELLSESVTNVKEPASPASLLDPTTAVAIHRAIRDSNFSAPATQLAGLLAQAGEITRTLESVVQGAAPVPPDDAVLKQMRSFCVALSRNAIAQQTSLYDKHPTHPFRK